jgi:hypothetical protein
MDIARASLRRALELHPNLMIAYSSLLNFAKNDDDDAELQRLLARATAVCPSCLAPRRQYLVALTPRWGGSYEKMEAYCPRSCRRSRSTPGSPCSGDSWR